MTTNVVCIHFSLPSVTGERLVDYRGSPDVQSGLYGSQVQSSEYSPSPRKYHIATRSHSPGGEKLKDSLLYWNTEAVRDCCAFMITLDIVNANDGYCIFLYNANLCCRGLSN